MSLEELRDDNSLDAPADWHQLGSPHPPRSAKPSHLPGDRVGGSRWLLLCLIRQKHALWYALGGNADLESFDQRG